MPTRDLCADLRNAPDPELGDRENVCSATNRHLRLYVAGWMLGGDVRRALELYETSGRPELLDAPGRLTTASIAAEVLQLRGASATNERMAAMGEAFDKRFDREPPAPGRFAVDYGADGLPEYEED